MEYMYWRSLSVSNPHVPKHWIMETLSVKFMQWLLHDSERNSDKTLVRFLVIKPSMIYFPDSPPPVSPYYPATTNYFYISSSLCMETSRQLIVSSRVSLDTLVSNITHFTCPSSLFHHNKTLLCTVISRWTIICDAKVRGNP